MSTAGTPLPSGGSPRTHSGLLRRVTAVGVWVVWLFVCLGGLGLALGYSRKRLELHHGWPWPFARRTLVEYFPFMDVPVLKRWQFWNEPEWVSPLALAGDLLLWLVFAAGGTLPVRRWLSSPRPWQLTLPRLFVLVGLVATGTAVWRHGRHDQRVLARLERFHRQDLELLQRYGASTKVPNPLYSGLRTERFSWWHDLTGIDWPGFFRVTHYGLRSLDPGRDLPWIARLSQLESLYISPPDSDPQLHKPLPALLRRSRPAPAGRQWALLRHLPYLRQLTVDGYDLSGVELAGIAQLGQLEYLALPRSPITDDDLPALAPLQNLKQLDLSFTQVTDRGLPSLLKLPRLQLVDLTGTRVTDAGVELLESRGIAVVDD